MSSSQSRLQPHASLSRWHRWHRLAGFLTACLLLVVCSSPARADSEFIVRQWHVQDGLPNDEVNAIAQDQDGYLWLATSGGFVRFDGSRFSTRLRSPGAESEILLATLLTGNPRHGLLAAVRGGGLLSRKGGAWVESGLSEALRGREIINVFSEEDGVLWVACGNGTVFRFNGNNVQEFMVPRGLPGARRIGFATDRYKRVWVTSDMTLLLLQGGQLVPFGQDFNHEELRIASSRGEGPWLVTNDRLLQLRGGQFSEQARLPSLLGAHYVQALVEDRRGVLWFGTRSNGLYRYEDGRLRRIAELGDDIYSLYEGGDGMLWVGSNGGGLAQLRAKTFQIFNKASGLLVDFSPTLCEDQQGRLWFANRDGGVVSLEDGAVRRHGPIPDWPSYSAVSVFPDTKGGIGFTCGSGAYSVGDGPGSPVTRIPSVPQNPIIRITLATRGGNVWMALSGDKLGCLSGGNFEVFSRAEGLSGAEIRSLAEDASGRILVGTASGELLRQEGNRFVLVPFGRRAPLSAIQSILVEGEQRLWLGTENDGLLCLAGETLMSCDARGGLAHNNITQILADDFGNLWLGSTAGIFWMKRAQVLDLMLGRAEHVDSLEIGQSGLGPEVSCVGQYQPAAIKGSDGRLWFATRRGVLALNPAAETVTPPVPRVALEELRVDDEAVPLTPELQLPGNLRKLEIRFSALCLAAPERVRLRYRLEGFDSTWTVASRERIASYPRLAPGEYRFRVEASLIHGTREESAAEFTLSVAPLWWQTWWVRGLSLLALAGVCVQGVRLWAHRRLRMKLERLERESSLERERARIARDIHDDLGASLSRISLLTQAARLSADAKSTPHLTQIYETVSQITRSMDEIVWAVDPKHDNLDDLASYLASYAQGFLSVAGIRCRLDLADEMPVVRLTSQRRHTLFLCLKEALNNVARHSGATEVGISMVMVRDEFRMSVFDNGHGIVDEAASPELPGSRLSRGNGLLNMKRRMQEVGGTCLLTSSPKDGTTVTFSIPLQMTQPVV